MTLVESENDTALGDSLSHVQNSGHLWPCYEKFCEIVPTVTFNEVEVQQTQISKCSEKILTSAYDLNMRMDNTVVDENIRVPRGRIGHKLVESLIVPNAHVTKDCK